MNKPKESADYGAGREPICRFTYDVESLRLVIIYVNIYGVSHEK